MEQFTFEYEIVYFPSSKTGDKITIEASNEDLARSAVMNRLINQIRKEGKSGGLKEIIIL